MHFDELVINMYEIFASTNNQSNDKHDGTYELTNDVFMRYECLCLFTHALL
jgi:hypothetical protein